jgi:hypothetical protein
LFGISGYSLIGDIFSKTEKIESLLRRLVMLKQLFRSLRRNKTYFKINTKLTEKERQLHKFIIGNVGTGRANHYVIPHQEMVKDK